MLIMHIKAILSELRLYLCNYWVSRLPSHYLRLFFYRKVMGFKLHDRATVFMGGHFYCTLGLSMGTDSVINENCKIDTRAEIKIGGHVVIASNVTILTADHNPRDSGFTKDRVRAVIIDDYSFICTGATILPGIKLGRGCMVGAGAVVTSDVAPYSVVAGNPAKVIGSRPIDLNYSTYYRRVFH
jgi:acetyltransferase-like isoleucine patch superfamily enzyme